MGKDGGTQLWCPNCESIQVCRVDATYIESDENRGNVFWHRVPSIRSLTPSVCKVSGLVIQAKKVGICQITFSVEGTSGNTLETLKKITFKN